jgi:TRAP-type C4-dicarboxylate transport system permease large subunit
VALVGSGGLFAVAFWAFLLGTNDPTQRSVRRVFVGGRMALCLLVLMITVTALVAVLIQKEPQNEAAESLLAILLVWFPASVIHLVLFSATIGGTRRPRRDDGEERGWRPADD